MPVPSPRSHQEFAINHVIVIVIIVMVVVMVITMIIVIHELLVTTTILYVTRHSHTSVMALAAMLQE